MYGNICMHTHHMYLVNRETPKEGWAEIERTKNNNKKNTHTTKKHTHTQPHTDTPGRCQRKKHHQWPPYAAPTNGVWPAMTHPCTYSVLNKSNWNQTNPWPKRAKSNQVKSNNDRQPWRRALTALSYPNKPNQLKSNQVELNHETAVYSTATTTNSCVYRCDEPQSTQIRSISPLLCHTRCPGRGE